MAESRGNDGHISDNLVDCVRQCVREELSRRSSGQQSLIQRTRQLISSSASSIARDMSPPNISGHGMQERSVSTRPQINQASRHMPQTSTPGMKRPQNVPGHNWRPKKRSTGQSKPPQPVAKSVYLLEESDSPDHEYSLIDDMILIKGQCDLLPNFIEKQIRDELASLFITKFPLITALDFDFVKRERNTISKPVVKESHKWDFKHVKNLCGNGRLYVRLNISSELLMNDTSATSLPRSESPPSTTASVFEENTTNQPCPSDSVQHLCTIIPNTGSADEASASASSQVVCQPSASADPTDLSDVEYLSTVFPNTRREVLRQTVLTHQNIDSAAEALCDREPNEKVTDSEGNETAHGILKTMRASMKPFGLAEKIKVDREDLVMDIFHYYKCPEFDPTMPIKIQVRGEPAVDTGGVLRQVFTEFFTMIAQGSEHFRLFAGPDGRLSPIYSSEHILTDVFEILGKIVAHSLIQGGPGFPYLAPGIFWYIATGDLEEAVARSSFLDIADPQLVGIIERIKDGGPSAIEGISQDDTFLRYMIECGETRLLTQKNKEEIVQCIVLHNCIIKHKAILDQFRKGLSILGFLKKLESSPNVFEKFFVCEGGEVTADYVRELLKTSDVAGQEGERVLQMLHTFIRNASASTLTDFLHFVTGSRSRTGAFLPGSISVSVGDTDSIFASTCTLSVKFPSCFTSYSQFESSMIAVMKGKSFTTA